MKPARDTAVAALATPLARAGEEPYYHVVSDEAEVFAAIAGAHEFAIERLGGAAHRRGRA